MLERDVVCTYRSLSLFSQIKCLDIFFFFFFFILLITRTDSDNLAWTCAVTKSTFFLAWFANWVRGINMAVCILFLFNNNDGNMHDNDDFNTHCFLSCGLDSNTFNIILCLAIIWIGWFNQFDYFFSGLRRFLLRCFWFVMTDWVSARTFKTDLWACISLDAAVPPSRVCVCLGVSMLFVVAVNSAEFGDI